MASETVSGSEATPSRGRVRVEPGAKRVRVAVAGVAVADTVHPLYVWETPYYPAYYLPVSDVRMDLLEPTATVTHSPSRGDASHFTVRVNGEDRVDAAYQYRDSPIEALRDHVRFEWGAMDAWLEENEEVFTHPRSPYTRVDILPTSRPVRVEVQGIVLADSPRALVLFETGLPPRWYLPKVDVRMDLLVHTDEASHCPYKGQAEYWSARVGEGLEENVVWSYRTPLPESERIAGYVSFFDERVDVFIDGERQERPKTRFS
jgi:uncharacterized protein (DUF427 family)